MIGLWSKASGWRRASSKHGAEPEGEDGVPAQGQAVEAWMDEQWSKRGSGRRCTGDRDAHALLGQGERLSEDVHREVLAFARERRLAIRLTSPAVVCSSTGGRGTGPAATAPAAAADFCLPMDHSKGC